RADWRDPREVPAKGDLRDQRARGRGRARRRRSDRARARFRAPARRHLPAQAQSAGLRDPGRRRLLRPVRAGDPEVAPAAGRRPDGRLRDELRQARRRRARRRGARLADAGAPHRPAEADRGDGRRRSRLPQRPRVPTRATGRAGARPAPGVHADDPGAGRARRRRVARRAAREDRVLERLQGGRLLVGRAAAVLARKRAVAFVAVAAGLTAYYFAADSIPRLSTWWEVTLLACALFPGVFLLDWLVLPLATARGLLPTAAAVAVLAVLAEVAELEVLANFAKLAAVTFFAFWFLNLFEELLLLAIVALIIPFIDAYSVFRGPTGNIVEHHSSVFFALPHEADDPRLGIPDLLFFALFLAASVRFGLRAGWTWVGMVLGLGA